MSWQRISRRTVPIVKPTSFHLTITVRRLRMTSTESQSPLRFGDFEVTEQVSSTSFQNIISHTVILTEALQVFLTTPHSFALVNLKPLLPGHVLVCPQRPHKRLTDLSADELTDLFSAVQRVERMLARHYFAPSQSPHSQNPTTPEAGSFNIALQDGPEAGQTVSHVHVHVIPRIRGYTAKPGMPGGGGGDELYEKMAAEDGNVGGALWDRAHEQQRPQPGGGFPPVEDQDRKARGMEEMEDEARVYRAVLEEMEREDGDDAGERGGKKEEKKANDVGSPDWWSRVWPKGGPTDAGPGSGGLPF
jgi:bis(5'-adenosyl)-triphosphatase